MKGITYGLFIRLNVLWGEGPGACDKGQFGKNWGCHSVKDAHHIHDKLVRILDSADPFVQFDALTFLIGTTGAKYFCDNHEGHSSRPSDVPQPSTSRRNLLRLSSDSDIEIIDD